MIIASFPKGSFPEHTFPENTFPAAFIDTTNIQYTEVMEFSLAIAAAAEFDVVLPNGASINVTGADIIVSGAGSTATNGTYTVYGDRDGKTRYRMASEGSTSGYFYIVWIAAYEVWSISRRGEDADSDLIIVSGAYYISADDVATPNLCTTWTGGALGSSPVPTVAPLIIPTLAEIAFFTLEMPTVIEIETYEELSA